MAASARLSGPEQVGKAGIVQDAQGRGRNLFYGLLVQAVEGAGQVGPGGGRPVGGGQPRQAFQEAVDQPPALEAGAGFPTEG